MKNTFFLENSYKEDIALEVNEDVLERIHEDDILETDKLNIEFAFVTDTKIKAEMFAEILRTTFKQYTDIKVKPYDKLFEVVGVTDLITMSLISVNEWNILMWDFGYKYDCKLDGWFVGS